MPRIAAVDFGLKRTGLAISDAQGIVALPLKIRPANTPAAILAALAAYAPATILVGLPLLLNGTKGEMALAAERFAAALQALTSTPVECVDERLTTAAANRALKEMGRSRKQGTQVVDSLAATLLLQAYLDRNA